MANSTLSDQSLSDQSLSDQSLSELIKKARERSNLTQTDFGRLFEPSMAQPTIAMWEKGKLLPARKHFPRIASLLDITLGNFFDLVSEELINSISENAIYVPNNRYLNVLNRGMKSWNRWREKNHKVIPQLSGALPKEDYLDKINLQNADLKGSFLQSKSFRASNFREANLSNANLSDANLTGGNLSNADLCNANLTGANLTNADLSGANLNNANLAQAILYNADLRKANLSHANLTNADLRQANLNDANLEFACLKNCFIFGIAVWNINLIGAVQEQLSVCPNKTASIYVNCIENAHLKMLKGLSSRSKP